MAIVGDVIRWGCNRKDEYFQAGGFNVSSSSSIYRGMICQIDDVTPLL